MPLKEAIIKEATITGVRTKYDEKLKRLSLDILFNASIPPSEIAKLMEVQRDGTRVHLAIKSYQASMELDGDGKSTS